MIVLGVLVEHADAVAFLIALFLEEKKIWKKNLALDLGLNLSNSAVSSDLVCPIITLTLSKPSRRFREKKEN